MTYVLPGLWPDDHPKESSNYGGYSSNSISKAWFSVALDNPCLFNVLLLSAVAHRGVLRGINNPHQDRRALSYKIKCIQQLNEIISDGVKALTDEVILTILGLAAHDFVQVPDKGSRPFNSPLQNAGALSFYGAVQYVPEHIRAITKLVSLRGGIDNLTMPGLSESIVMLVDSW